MPWALIDTKGNIRGLYAERPAGKRPIEGEPAREAVNLPEDDPRVVAVLDDTGVQKAGRV